MTPSTDPAGHDSILGWLESFGAIARIGVEGSRGKSDPVDAIAAARAAVFQALNNIIQPLDKQYELHILMTAGGMPLHNDRR